MTWWDAAFLAAAGVLGGLTGSIAGFGVGGHLSRPAVGGPAARDRQRDEHGRLGVQRHRVGAGFTPGTRRPGPMAQAHRASRRGGWGVGAVLLLSTPAEGFEKVVPLLLAFASIAILVPPRARKEAAVASHRRHTATLVLESAAIFVICIYGGYFGAAAGVLLLAILLRAGERHWPMPTRARTSSSASRTSLRPSYLRFWHRCSGRR